MQADEIAALPRVDVEPPPALPSSARADTVAGAPTDAALLDPAVEPPPLLPSPRIRTWRPPSKSSPEEERERLRRACERRDRLKRERLFGALWTSLKIGVIVFITYGLIFNFSIVRGSSMAPGIHDGDRILVDHLTLLFRDVHRGDIVVLQYPLDPSLDYIKRVIGLPGDEVCIDAGRVFVNGVRLEEPYIADADPRTSLRQRVAPDSFFVLGDNRPHSSDSREFGQVPRENLIGLVNLRVWPPARLGVLE